MRAIRQFAVIGATATVTFLVAPLMGSAQAITVESALGVSSEDPSGSFSVPSFRGAAFYSVARTLGLGIELGIGDRGTFEWVSPPFSCLIGGTPDATMCTVEGSRADEIRYAVLTLRVEPTSGRVGGHFDGGLGLYDLRVREVSTTFGPTGAVVDRGDHTWRRWGVGPHLGAGVSLELPGTPISFLLDGRYHFVLTSYSGGPSTESLFAVALGARLGTGW